MVLSLQNSTTKEKIALTKKNVNIYLCGPTVYDDAHLGHARSSVCFDLLRRVLLALDYEVKFARNYTDIDDKILKKMAQTGQNLEQISEHYILSYEKDMKALRVLEPDFKPRATHYISQMINLISRLEKSGFTYALKDGIYFDTSKDKSYLNLSNRAFENNISRLQNETNKKNESDFVLWKFDENFYESPFGCGRPGWHTECVTMIDEIFKNELDIHAGGIDLLFPHHENEVAQCRCANSHDLAKIWLHNGFVKIEGEKMSKSLNNSFFIKDALKDFCGEALRFYLLSSHYRAHFNYSLQDLRAASKRLDKIYRLKKRLNLSEFKDFNELEKKEFKSPLAREILKALSDDLNISKALAIFDEFLNNANLALDKENKNKVLRAKLCLNLEQTGLIFGLGFMDSVSYFQQGVSEKQKEFINEQILLRNEAKKAKNYALADEIRVKLLEQNINLQDSPSGTIWEKINV